MTVRCSLWTVRLKSGGGVVAFLTPKAKDYKIGEKNVYIKKSYSEPIRSSDSWSPHQSDSQTAR